MAPSFRSLSFSPPSLSPPPFLLLPPPLAAQYIALGSLFLATKVEECPKKLRDVLQVFMHLEQKRLGLKPEPADIYSNRFKVYKDALIKAEREILKELGFILYTEHPHKFILNYCKLVRARAEPGTFRCCCCGCCCCAAAAGVCSASDGPSSPSTLRQLTNEEKNLKPLAQYAWNFINDSQRTDVCMKYPPETICCAALWMGARKLQIKLPTDSEPPWWVLFDTKKEDMDAVVARVNALYSRGKATFIDLMKEGS